MEEYRVIIAGGREFDDYGLLKDKCRYLLSSKIVTNKVIIISGHAKGADNLGERFAKEFRLQYEIHPADWGRHGKAAGHIRNAEMAEISDALIAFWDGKSHGTAHMIKTAQTKGLKVTVIKY